MSELVRFPVEDGWLLVEADPSVGTERVARRDPDGVVVASGRIEDAIAAVKPAVTAVLSRLRELSPDDCEIEFGIKLTAETTVVIAKTAVEGHFTVRMGWRRPAEQD